MNAHAEIEEFLSRTVDGEPPGERGGSVRKMLADPEGQTAARKWIAFEMLLRAVVRRPDPARLRAGKARLLAQAAAEARRKPANLAVAGLVTVLVVALAWAAWMAAQAGGVSAYGDVRSVESPLDAAVEVIVAGPDGGGLRLGRRADVALSAGAVIEVKRRGASAELRLRSGTASVEVEADAGPVTLRAASGAATARDAARFRLRADGDASGRAAVVRVERGEVVVSDAWGFSTLGPGETRRLDASPDAPR